MPGSLLPARVRAWLTRWSPLLPLFVAEFILWIGFGALLPVMPFYFTEHGVDIAMLGVVVAAWPATRLVAEPIFGWIADRVPRVPLMVAGLLIAGSAIGLSLVWTGPLPFLALRALAGFGTAIYDPAARGYLTDAAPHGGRGEVFGMYGAAQMGGLLLGPAFGGIGASMFGGFAFVFGFSALASLAAAVTIALRMREGPRGIPRPLIPATGVTEFPAEGAPMEAHAAADLAAEQAEHAHPSGSEPTTIRNRLLLAAIIFNLGGWFAGAMYEVVWSLFLQSRGAGLDLIGLTFAMFGLPVLLISPWAGRQIDRRGPYAFILIGSLATTITMILYPFVPDPILVVPLIVIEGTGFALSGPALYAVVAAGTPAGRSSTVQGIYGSFGTGANIIASVLAGFLAARDLAYPFWLGATVLAIVVVIGIVVDGGRIRARFARAPA